LASRRRNAGFSGDVVDEIGEIAYIADGGSGEVIVRRKADINLLSSNQTPPGHADAHAQRHALCQHERQAFRSDRRGRGRLDA
jgi:hypothetical protein